MGQDLLAQLLETTAKQFKKKFKDSDTEFRLAKDEKPVNGLVVDNPLFEYILDRRFIAYGRFYLAYGKKGSSKTSLFFDIAKLFQRNGGGVLWLETENAADLDYARKQGVDIEQLQLIHPQTLEEALNIAELYIRNLPKVDPEGTTPLLICLDSIAGSATEYERDTSHNISDTTPGAHARLLSRFYREMEHPLANEHCVFLTLNQLKEKIGGMGGFGGETPESMIGGEAPRFSSTYQWKMAYTGALKAKNAAGVDRKFGSTHEIVCKRNKLGREGNMQKVKVDLYINGGIDWYSPLVKKLGEDGYSDLVSSAGARHTWKVDGVTYKKDDGSELLIPTDAGYYDRDLAAMIGRSEQAKELIRAAFEIPDLPSEEQVKEIEKERLTKRKKKKTLDEDEQAVARAAA
jgi:recombination protein RecA